ncbi:MAG: NUDIX hydrolase [Anaerolineaceae bacterium]|nr:NUDIX hydrolase [Anaerolineaceae bacterium]MCB9099705.1 NUDIX hydrolase [Anaerolineales bacterium]
MNLKKIISILLQQVIPLRGAFSLAVKLFAPRNQVGVMAAIFNDLGQVLLVEHVFRPQQPWGLPGGWVERGEDPAHSIQRELQEELNLTVEVKKLLFCESQGGEALSSTPLGLAIVFYARIAACKPLPPSAEPPHSAYEVLSYEWVLPHQIKRDLSPQQYKAILLGQREFDKEKSKDNVSVNS